MRKRFKSILSSMRPKSILTYMIALICPVLITLIVYGVSYGMVMDFAVDRQLLVLERAKQNMDANLETLSNVSYLISQNPKVIGYYSNPPSIDGIYPAILYNLRSNLPDYQAVSTFRFQYFVIFKNSEVVINNRYIYTLKNFLSDYMRIEGMPSGEFYQIVLESTNHNKVLPARDVHYVLEKKDIKSLFFVTTLRRNLKNFGSVFIVFDDEIIYDIMDNIGVSNGGYVYIESADGEVITTDADLLSIDADSFRTISGLMDENASGSFRYNINNRKMLITYTVSEGNGWKYVSAQPYSVVLSPVNTLLYITVATFAAAIILGVTLALRLAWRHTVSINELVSDKEKLSEYVSKQIPYIRKVLLDKLLIGSFGDMDIDELSPLININASSYCTVIIKLIYMEGLPDTKLIDGPAGNLILIDRIVKELLKGRAMNHELSQDMLAIVLFYDRVFDADMRFLYDDVEMIKKRISEIGIDYFIMAVGGVCSCVQDISRSYADAMELIKRAPLNTGGLILSSSHDIVDRGSIHYSDNMYFRLEQYIKGGNGDEAVKELEELYRINYEINHIDMTMHTLLMNNVAYDLSKIFDSLQLDGNHTERLLSLINNNDTDIKSIFYGFETICLDVCSIINEKRGDRKKQLAENMKIFIDENYPDSNLSMTMLSRKFNMSETYLSMIFKDVFFEHCSAYIQRIRMEQASVLLKDGSISINQICAMVGYNSVNTFDKAFKRYYGMPPSSARSS